jgi:predicted tellurium resistance membrane protein TerC
VIDLLATEVLVAFLQVVMIDRVLAGDNAVVIGLAAAGLPPDQRRRAILVGILAATALRILFAGVTMQLLPASCRRDTPAVGVLEDVA